MKAVIQALLVLAASFSAIAQDAYPSKTVRIVVPFPAGGVADLLPRLVAERLSAKWGQPVVVENKAGAAGNIGMGEVARSSPDGYTIGLAPTGNLTVNPTLFPNMGFDTRKEIVPVTLLAQSPNVLVVNPSVPAKNLRELIAYAKANPGKLNFASPGEGSGAHLAGELLNQEAGIQAVHIPYKGLAPAVSDLLGGQVQMMFAGISTVIQQVRAGKLVAIAIASPKRNAQMPDVPTVAESGLPGFDVTSWYGFVVRSGTPQPVIDRIQHDSAEALQSPAVQSKLAELGLEPVGNIPAQFAAIIDAETKKWGAIVQKAGIKPQQ